MVRNNDGTFKNGHNQGRPKGAANKTTKQIRETITAFVSKQQEQFESDWLELSPRERTRAYIDLVQYILPKLKAVETQETQLLVNVEKPIKWTDED